MGDEEVSMCLFRLLELQDSWDLWRILGLGFLGCFKDSSGSKTVQGHGDALVSPDTHPKSSEKLLLYRFQFTFL